MPAQKAFKFTGVLDEIDNMLVKTVVYIPETIMKKLPGNRVRVKGKINGASFALAVQYRKSGQSFFVISKPLRKAAGSLNPGDKVTVDFVIVSDKVEIPEEMEAVLAQDDEGMAAWKLLTPGLQRSLCHYVNGVKDIDSRIKRALFIVNKVKQGGYSPSRLKKTGTLKDE